MIEGHRITLRAFEEGDIPALLAWAADEEIEALVEGDYPRTEEDVAAWLGQYYRNPMKRHYMIDRPGRGPIGDIELDYIAWRSGEAELRIRIGERDCWNKGYGTESIIALLRHAFFELGLRRIYLRVLAHNRRAIRCYRKCGFRPEGSIVRAGKDGLPRRIILMRVLRGEFVRMHEAAPWERQPAVPRPAC